MAQLDPGEAAAVLRALAACLRDDPAQLTYTVSVTMGAVTGFVNAPVNPAPGHVGFLTAPTNPGPGSIGFNASPTITVDGAKVELIRGEVADQHLPIVADAIDALAQSLDQREPEPTLRTRATALVAANAPTLVVTVAGQLLALAGYHNLLHLG